MLSFQSRVLILVMLVAVTATGVTASLTFRLASAQVAAVQAANAAATAQVVKGLVSHAIGHGSWLGLGPVVSGLERSTEREISLTTQSGIPVAGSGPRPSGNERSQTIQVDPHPVLAIGDEDAAVASGITSVEIDAFRSGTRLAACLAAAGIGVDVETGRNGVPHYGVPRSNGSAPSAAAADRCRASAVSTDAERNEDVALVSACTATTSTVGARLTCLKSAFLRRTKSVGPEPLLLSVRSQGKGGLAAAPIAAAALVVMAFAALASVLVSRRALRPITALTRAVRQLGQGDLGGRAPVKGNDQLAELTRSFNRMADSLQQGEERQRRMIGDVAHELRTPLSNLRGHLEGLMDGVIPPGPELFSSLHDEALLQQRIVDDLQDLALAEAGALTYRRCEVDLSEVLQTCQQAHSARAETTGARLVVQAYGETWVIGDPDRLRQVISNLVSNALRYTPAGGTVTLRSGTVGAAAVVQVVDTGCGIAEENLPRLFDRFWRADKARGRTTGGSGLGLAIARQIVTDHGGTIAADSRPGEGATFTIRLPAVAVTPVGRHADSSYQQPVAYHALPGRS